MGDIDVVEEDLLHQRRRGDDTSSDQSSLPSDIVQFKARPHMLMDDVECSPIEPTEKDWNDYRDRVQENADHMELLGDDESSDTEDQNEIDEEYDAYYSDMKSSRKETTREFLTRQFQNIVHFFVEDWFISAALGFVTAIFSIFIDIGIEYLIHCEFPKIKFHSKNINSVRNFLLETLEQYNNYAAFLGWVFYITGLVYLAALVCYGFGKQAVGSGIPEVKVIIHGFQLKNYLSGKTLIAKMIGLTLTIGSGLPVGKEGPFVHIGAIVASLLNKITAACQYNAFFSNEGRAMEMLSIGCAVGIACTFSAPMGAVLYGIESTSKYFAVKNYWRSFFATTCSAMLFRFAITFFVPQHIAGTITAYYQTYFPNEVFVVEELGFFVCLGFVKIKRGEAVKEEKKNFQSDDWTSWSSFRLLSPENCILQAPKPYLPSPFWKEVRQDQSNHFALTSVPILFTACCAAIFAVLVYPNGLGSYVAGKYTFRETLVDFLSNCTLWKQTNGSEGCPPHVLEHWSGPEGDMAPINSLLLYFLFYFIVVPICITLYIPSGIFVPCFVIGACGGRIFGEIISMIWPYGLRGIGQPQIYPGLYAVVGAASFTGSVTHSLSIALIVCETTGQLCALLPVLIALMISNAICAFLQPSIYDSIIKINGYPYLADLPPSRMSVHQMKVERIMVKDMYYITRETTYRELREMLLETPTLRSYPFVTDSRSMTLLGSVARKYLLYLIQRKLGPEPELFGHRRRSRTASEIFSTIHNLRKYSRRGSLAANGGHMSSGNALMTDRNISGNTLLPQSPLHEDQGDRSPLAPLLYAQTNQHEPIVHSLAKRAEILSKKLDMEEVAIDPAPFQLVRGTSLYKVHTLFSLLALNHAYVTEKGRLVGVVAVKELREALSNIYSRGAVVPRPRVRTSTFRLNPDQDCKLLILIFNVLEYFFLVENQLMNGQMNGENTVDASTVRTPRVTIEAPEDGENEERRNN
ncbi:Protein CBR-CLH-1 [Caenorhabditis briggsae]|uniref:Protein CBR-CLH-1 n=1 Tax=Caenorhabditis briggsae TaxID=6238 RepID=A8WSR3_CAEBR|nr:Protein CBR-CLH-1 [Caenorhabditis briggsae]CAP23522.2 Protein CBR-CLH-1 [Caenorhabditis briggsae]